MPSAVVAGLIPSQPRVTATVPTELGPQAINAYLAEYNQCAETYRSTYNLIWSAGALFTGATGALLVAANLQTNPIRGALIFAPLPIIFWDLGLFRPMNRYVEGRTWRLADLEELLSDAVPNLDMEHFRQFNARRYSQGWLETVFHPRVRYLVLAFFSFVVLLELYLLGNFQLDMAFPQWIRDSYRLVLVAGAVVLGLYVVVGEVLDELALRRRTESLRRRPGRAPWPKS